MGPGWSPCPGQRGTGGTQGLPPSQARLGFSEIRRAPHEARLRPGEFLLGDGEFDPGAGEPLLCSPLAFDKAAFLRRGLPERLSRSLLRPHPVGHQRSLLTPPHRPSLSRGRNHQDLVANTGPTLRSGLGVQRRLLIPDASHCTLMSLLHPLKVLCLGWRRISPSNPSFS